MDTSNFSKQFIQQLKAREKHAIEELYTGTESMIYSYILYKVGGDIHNAEDILSDVYCAAINYLDRLNTASNIKAWLFRIAKTKVIDFYRRVSRDSKIVKIQKIIEVKKSLRESAKNHPESLVLQNEQRYLIAAGFSRLPQEYRFVLNNKYLKEMSTKEIAGLLNKTEKAVESILYRGKKLFLREIKKMEKEKIYFTRGSG